jgi:hypothetical protein
MVAVQSRLTLDKVIASQNSKRGREAAMIGSAARAYRLAIISKNCSNPAYAGAGLGPIGWRAVSAAA